MSDEPLFLRRESRGRVDVVKECREIRAGLRTLMADIDGERKKGREEVYREIEKAFKPDDAFKGRLYFNDVNDFIQLIKTRLKKETNVE